MMKYSGVEWTLESIYNRKRHTSTADCSVKDHNSTNAKCNQRLQLKSVVGCYRLSVITVYLILLSLLS